MPDRLTVVPVHAAGDGAWSWQLLADELRRRGHDVVAIDLPADDESASLPDYADAIVDAVGDRPNLVVVGHSFGGFTAPLVCTRIPVRTLVMLTAMIPTPGEPPADWWTNTGHADAVRAVGRPAEGDLETYYHDVPRDLAMEALRRERNHPSNRAYGEPWPLEAWPDVPTRALVCTEDRVFPAEWMRGVVRARLGIDADEIRSGHCPMLSRPAELAERLVEYGSR
jgi:pimeloyl-ACP methyl ester carboxylesterase